MDKRYQVFLSSTYRDLTEERLEVIKALLELDCIPSGMEYFPAASEDSWTYIAGLIEQCDYYVVVVGGRYGSLTPEGISFTQKEYQHALKHNIPAIAFIHRSPEELPAKKTEDTENGKEKLDGFIKILKANLCKEWSNSHELGAVVSRSITQLIKRHPRTGWLPANQATSKEATEEILELTKRVKELEEELTKINGQSSIDATGLADGQDKVALDAIFDVSEKSENWRGSSVVRKLHGSVEVSWEEIFASVALKITPMATDAQARSAVNLLIDRNMPSKADGLKNGQWLSKGYIEASSFDLIKLQLSALGVILIDKELDEYSGRTKPVWRLTKRGQDRRLKSLSQKRIKSPGQVSAP